MFFLFLEILNGEERRIRMKLVRIFLHFFYRKDCNSDSTATFTTFEFTYQHIPFIKKHPPLNAHYTICILKMSMVLPHRKRGSHLIIQADIIHIYINLAWKFEIFQNLSNNPKMIRNIRKFRIETEDLKFLFWKKISTHKEIPSSKIDPINKRQEICSNSSNDWKHENNDEIKFTLFVRPIRILELSMKKWQLATLESERLEIARRIIALPCSDTCTTAHYAILRIRQIEHEF